MKKSLSGMYPFDALPITELRKLGIDITPEHLLQLQKGTGQIRAGGDPSGSSGGFISTNRGIKTVFRTNWHTIQEILSNLLPSHPNILRDGYIARSAQDELPCPGATITVLESITDVTSIIHASLKGKSSADAEKAKRAAINKLEAKGKKRTGNNHQVYSFSDGTYKMYEYLTHKDIRLVRVAPKGLAFCNTHNFEFDVGGMTRTGLDISELRVWKDGQPAIIPHYFTPSSAKLTEGTFLVSVGSPGATNWSRTSADMQFQLNIRMPVIITCWKTLRTAMEAFAKRSKVSRSSASYILMKAQNQTLVAEANMRVLPQAIKAAANQDRQDRRVARGIESLRGLESCFSAIESANEVRGKHYRALYLLEHGHLMAGALFEYGQFFVRLAEERNKPDDERLPDFTDGNFERVSEGVVFEQRFDLALEKTRWAVWFGLLKEMLPDHPVAITLLAGRTPQLRAQQIIAGTMLHRSDVRKALLSGDATAVAHLQNDSIISFLRSFDAAAREIRKEMNELDAKRQQAYVDLAKIRVISNAGKAPDANSTPRITFGTIRSYREGRKKIGPFSPLDQIGRHLRSHAERDAEPLDLPRKMPVIRGRSPLNWTADLEIVGGQSGSFVFVLNEGKLEPVGNSFDGNRLGAASDIYWAPEARDIVIDFHGAEEVFRALGMELYPGLVKRK